jgi:hypothetical protein
MDLDDASNSDDVIMAGSLTNDERGSSIMTSPEDSLGLDLGILLASDHVVTTYRYILYLTQISYFNRLYDSPSVGFKTVSQAIEKITHFRKLRECSKNLIEEKPRTRC